MKRTIVYLCLSLLLFIGCNKLVLHDGIETTYYPNGDKFEEGPVDKKGLRTGAWKNYYPDGKIMNKINYLNGVKNGLTVDYFSSGKVSDSVYFQNNKLFGLVKFFYPNGMINFEDYYSKNDPKLYEFKLYYLSGKLSQTGGKRNGLMVGKWIKYYEDGNIDNYSHYDSLGKKDSIWVFYKEDGSIKKREIYKADSLISK